MFPPSHCSYLWYPWLPSLLGCCYGDRAIASHIEVRPCFCSFIPQSVHQTHECFHFTLEDCDGQSKTQQMWVWCDPDPCVSVYVGIEQSLSRHSVEVENIYENPDDLRQVIEMHPASFSQFLILISCIIKSIFFYPFFLSLCLSMRFSLNVYLSRLYY